MSDISWASDVVERERVSAAVLVGFDHNILLMAVFRCNAPNIVPCQN